MPIARAKNYLLVLLALTTVAGGVLAWNQYQELIKLRAAGLDDNARADLQKRLWALEKRNHELLAEVADLRARQNGGEVADANGDGGAPGDPAGPRGPGQGRFNRRGGFAGLTTLMDNPQFAQLLANQTKARVDDAFKPLFKSLNLSPDQTAKLESLLAERQSSLMDALSVARSQGITGRDQIQQLVQQANSQIDGQIQALLGPDGYAQYNNYLQTMPQRNQVGQLQVRLATDGITQLQDVQAQQLTQILAQNSQGGMRGGNFGAMGAMGGVLGPPVTGPTISPSAVAQAAGVLTPEQLQTLQQMQQEQATQQQIMSALRDSFRAGGATAPAGTATTTAPTAQPVSRPPGS